MSTTTYRVTGMTCGHCEASVVEEVTALGGVQSASASAATGTLTVHGAEDLEQARVLAAVREAGYTAEPDASSARDA